MGILSGLLGAISAPFLGPLGPALIGGASSIVGGALSKPKNSYQVPDYAGIRSKAEAAGFNPLTALQFAPGQSVQSQNYMGQAIADAGMMLADSMAKNRASGQVSKLQQANSNLAKRVQNLTLRPKVGGIYAQRQAVPSTRAALGVSDGQASAGDSLGVSAAGAARVGGSAPLGADVQPLLANHPLDPRRDVDNLPITSDAGFVLIDNPALGEPFPVPAINGEVLDLGQSAVVGGSYVADKLAKDTFADHVVGGFQAMEADGNALARRIFVGKDLPMGWGDYPDISQIRVTGTASTKKWKPARGSGVPRFQLGPQLGLGRPRKWPFGPYAQ